MPYQKYKLICFVLMIVFVTAIFVPACKKKDRMQEAVDANETKEFTHQEPQYANDFDRLGVLSERINKANGKTSVFTLGSSNSQTMGSLISIDYALFDRLSDDGAAALMAHALAMRSQVSVPSAAAQSNNDTSILLTDETAGFYIGRAGFRSEGFTEFLKMSRITKSENTPSTVSDDMRLDAFMRGYLSAKANK